MESVDEVVESLSTGQWPFAGMVIGALIGALIALVVTVVLSLGLRKNLVFGDLKRRTSLPVSLMFISLGAWMGFTLTTPPEPPDWYQHVAHVLLVAIILLGGWTFYAGLAILGDKAILSDVRTGRDMRRFATQAQILRRVSQWGVVSLTIILVLLTFPAARAPMASVLASAGLMSIVAGLAAQTTLGNVIAGLQLAFTDALRVGDNIVVPGEEQPGVVEEITLTYVVVRIWDERRMILPSSEFTSKGFENWTRKSPAQLAAFSIQVDWTAPVAEIRAELQRLLEATDLWDGRTWSLQVYDLTGPYMTLRVTVSGENWARLQDLRAYLRENLVGWVRENTPWALPRERLVTSQGSQERPVMATDAVDKQMLTGPSMTGPYGGGDFTKEELVKPDPDAVFTSPEPAHKVHAALFNTGRNDSASGTRLFSGTPDGHRRSALFAGPGQETLWHRTLRAIQRKKEEESIPQSGFFDEDVVKAAEVQAAADTPGGGDAEKTTVEPDASSSKNEDVN
ncbi:mechanosensitive ion channel family protein [Actinomyces minihominis]|uniref:mechanosensitive ion channel family protein n=1 Tax=Actinomyces minihominis TaxID=2002838 RepID=UPI000C0869CE|nr:mechanosensitive ion channel family protein [Actinomyces minihominis]